ncbi:MAG: glycosyltransferase, partial [Actinoplanes sp.]
GGAAATSAGVRAEQSEVSTEQIIAVVIAKDEAAMLAGCLESLTGVADEVRVHDTGSSDDTRELAAAHGATVTRGPWTDDFAAARNEAAAAGPAGWILAIDADHRIRADPEHLRAFLSRTDADALLVEVHDAHHADPYTQLETRLYRPAAARWVGRVHERLVRPDGSAPGRATLPPAAARLTHLGYATYPDRIRRAARNLDLARRTVEELAGRGPEADREPVAHALLALGRDCAAAERRQDAVDTFELLRELFPGTAEWVQATDRLARIMLASGHDKVVVLLAEQLRDAGTADPYCDWLVAQALAQLGDPHAAAHLLTGVGEVVDPAGRRHDPAALYELKSLVGQLCARV